MTKLALLAALSGCSIATLRGPGDWTPDSKRAPVCDTDGFMPALVDAGLGVIALGVGAAGTQEGNCSSGEPGCVKSNATVAGGAAVMIIGATAAIVSIVIGRNRVRDCRAAQAEYGAR